MKAVCRFRNVNSVLLLFFFRDDKNHQVVQFGTIEVTESIIQRHLVAIEWHHILGQKKSCSSGLANGLGISLIPVTIVVQLCLGSYYTVFLLSQPTTTSIYSLTRTVLNVNK